MPSHLLNDPLSFWHAYAHALQSAAHGYHDVPHNAQDAGAIWESNSAATAFVEGVASWFATWVSQQVTPPAFQPAPLSQYRRPKFLEHNDYWMGYDGYGLGSNAATTEARNTPGKLWSDGINDNASTGDNVAGGIATLLWNLGPKYFAQALAAQTAEQFYASLASDASVDAAFIDQGLAVTDDPLEPNDIMSSATLLPIGTTLRDGLILAETEAGRGDWYRISIPAVGVAKTYALTTRVRFNGKQGDLDLVVRSADGQLVATDVRRGGDSALIHLTGLDGKKSYTFLIGVFGHGALRSSGDPSAWGGDYSPYYTLQISYPGRILPYKPTASTSTTSFNSWDPNEKVGPSAAGANRYIHDAAALPYTVYFENDPEQATVSAQRVVITDQLDADLDWSTFQFGTIQFGERTLLVPDAVGRLHYETDTTVSYDAYPVHVTADLDPQTGIVTWELQSVDPQTGRLPHDLRAGFLPPNDDQNHGAGSVSYHVRPKTDLSHGTQLCNQASIVFDFNEPIITNEVVYAIDATPPSSAVASLAATMDFPTFPVSWSGTDAGAGIASFDVYVSDNGGHYQPWLTSTAQTSASYTGVWGHSYAFYSVATDLVGHHERPPLSADTTTSIVDMAWHHADMPLDVSDDGFISPFDALLIINRLNSVGSGALPKPSSGFQPPPYYDVSADGDISPRDALLVINYLNTGHAEQPEGEAEEEANNTLSPAARALPLRTLSWEGTRLAAQLDATAVFRPSGHSDIARDVDSPRGSHERRESGNGRESRCGGGPATGRMGIERRATRGRLDAVLEPRGRYDSADRGRCPRRKTRRPCVCAADRRAPVATWTMRIPVSLIVCAVRRSPGQ